MVKSNQKSKKQRIRDFKVVAPIPDINGESTNNLHPAFCFEYNTTKHYSVNDLDKEEKGCLLEKLYELGQNNWGKIQISPRQTNGHEKIPVYQLKRKLCLPQEQTFVLVFRFAKGRIIGFRKGQTFYISAIDTKFDCYDHS